MNREQLLKSCANSEEKLSLAKTLDILNLSMKNHVNTFTGFLDPVKANKFANLIKLNFDMNVKLYGGFLDAERKMLGFTTEHLILENNDFPIETLKISYNKKFSTPIAHRDFLGSILGLGIERVNIGDILISDENTTTFVFKPLASYILNNLTKVAHTKVSVEIANLEKDFILTEEKKEKRITVSSLRIDAVISSAINLSRTKTQNLINSEKVFINWIPVISTSKQVLVGDIITIRGFGRVKFLSLEGKSKKDKLILNIQVLSNK